MDSNSNLNLYEMLRNVPDAAKKPIQAGRLKGFTDINPMWRIKRLTEVFGPCGIGWWYVVVDMRTVSTETGEIAAFVDIDLYYKTDGEVSQPISGTGGSMLVAKEQHGLYTSDEAFKMALTDAISVAAKALGLGADVYFSKDPTSNYGERNTGNAPQGNADRNRQSNAPSQQANYFKCESCGQVIKPYIGADGNEVGVRKHSEGSKKKFGKLLCINCITDMQQNGEA